MTIKQGAVFEVEMIYIKEAIHRHILSQKRCKGNQELKLVINYIAGVESQPEVNEKPVSKLWRDNSAKLRTLVGPADYLG